MDTTDPDIVFTETGCNHCDGFFETQERLNRDKSLFDTIKAIKARGRAILGISGGVDSAYVAYLARYHDLDVLLVHIDDGWNTEAAKTNVEAIVRNSGFDCDRIEVNREEYNDAFLSFMKAGVVDLECPTDNMLEAVLHQWCDDFGIKTILSGSNHATEGIMPKSWVYDNSDAKNIQAIHKKYGTMELEHIKLMGRVRKTWRLTRGGIRVFKPLNDIYYNRSDMLFRLNADWGFQDYGRKHTENALTKFIECFILPRKFNVDKRLPHFSALICSGQLSRDDAIEMLKEPVYGDELLREKQTFMERLGLTEQDFLDLMNAPVQSHRDFATQEFEVKLMQLARRVLRVRKIFRR
jgi:hypothetical protein